MSFATSQGGPSHGFAPAQGLGAGGAAAFSPTDVSGLVVWLDFSLASSLYQASNGTTAVTTDADPIGYATDLSGNARHFTQATAGLRPLWKTAIVAGKAAARFDQSGLKFMVGPTLAALTAGEIFVVFALSADPPAAGHEGLMKFGDAGAADPAYPFSGDSKIYDEFGSTARNTTVDPATSLTAWGCYGVTSTATEWTNRLNNTELFTTGANTVSFSAAPQIGGFNGGASRFMDGWIAEVLLYDAKVSAPNRASIDAYLSSKYGITFA